MGHVISFHMDQTYFPPVGLDSLAHMRGGRTGGRYSMPSQGGWAVPSFHDKERRRQEKSASILSGGVRRNPEKAGGIM